jgi:hypothetical protein
MLSSKVYNKSCPQINAAAATQTPRRLRESTFIMPRGGDEDVKGGGGTEIFSGIKRGALKVLDILKGGLQTFQSFGPVGA